MIHRWFISSLLVSALVLTGCSMFRSAPQRELLLTVDDAGCTPNTLEARAGEQVTLTLNNVGTQEHHFAVQEIPIATSGGGMGDMPGMNMAGMSGDMSEMAFELPFANGAFDHVVTSLVIHHLTQARKQQTFVELFSILGPKGELYVVDFGQPHSPLAAGIGQIMRRFEQVADNLDGLLPEFMRRVGFNPVETCANYMYMTVMGTLTLLRARRPGWPDTVG